MLEFIDHIRHFNTTIRDLNAELGHVLRQGNLVADSLTLYASLLPVRTVWNHLNLLPQNLRGLITLDRSAVPSIRTCTRAIKVSFLLVKK